MKGYSSGLRHGRVTILNRQEQTVGAYGIDSGGVGWTEVATVWADVSFVKGLRAMREGALDVYGVVMVRMNWNPDVTLRSRIAYDGRRTRYWARHSTRTVRRTRCNSMRRW